MEKSIALLFANRLRELMRHLNWTQVDLANMLRVSQPTISAYLKGRMPPADVLFRLAGIGGRDMEWFLSAESAPATVREASPAYGEQAVLLARWEKLPAALRVKLLELMAEMLREINTDDAEQNG